VIVVITANRKLIQDGNRCERLGLVSLSYLWQREQHQLLDDMCQCPLEAILIKVASLGLKISHLNQTIQQLQPYFTSVHHKYGFHVCGEGGEYETLTLDSPLFLKRIVLDQVESIVESSDPFSPLAYLKIHSFHLEEKAERSPERIRMEDIARQMKENPPASSPAPPSEELSSSLEGAVNAECKRTGRFICARGYTTSGSAPTQTLRTLEHLEKVVQAKYQVDIRTHAVFVHLYVREMSQFAQINAAYVKFFDATQPPSRECVSFNGWMEGVDVMIEIISVDDVQQKSMLHVQSISEWAPACIGPYSQACWTSGIVHLAGMIGLVPGTMELTERGEELKRSLDSLEQVLSVVDSSPNSVLSYTLYYVEELLPTDTSLSQITSAIQQWMNHSDRPVVGRLVGVKQLPRSACTELQLITHSTALSLSMPQEDSDSEEISISCKEPLTTNILESTSLGSSGFLQMSVVRTTPLSLLQAHFGWSDDKDSKEYCQSLLRQLSNGMASLDPARTWDQVSRIRVFYCHPSFPGALEEALREVPGAEGIPLVCLPASGVFLSSSTDPLTGSLEMHFYQ